MLRFDVETIYKATQLFEEANRQALRFDVETIYKATYTIITFALIGCGLM